MSTAVFFTIRLGLLKRLLVCWFGIFFAFFPLFFLANCSFLLLDESSQANISFDKSSALLLVIDGSLEASLRPSLDQYEADLLANRFHVYNYTWNGGTAEDLKAVLSNYFQTHQIDGAFLIGNLPTSWYEMVAFESAEEFPCDLYFMDLDSSWQDQDMNGIYDKHSPLFLDIYTSRIMGSSEELIKYFDKVHRFRKGTFSLAASAYIFKDDDWAFYNQGYAFGLDQIYKTINFCERIDDTIKPTYVSTLTNGGAEYVYQWIHSHPSALCVEYNHDYQYIDIRDINRYNFKGNFYNLFDCSASRFTQENIAMTYLTQTDYALATLGSTKVGGNYYPLSFNITLSKGGTWGDAFKVWYNYYGVSDDSWFLGMMILGDPLLKVSLKSDPFQVFRSLSPLPAPGPDEKKVLEEKMKKDRKISGSQGFLEYKAKNSCFFK
jgi:hypothetical protein